MEELPSFLWEDDKPAAKKEEAKPKADDEFEGFTSSGAVLHTMRSNVADRILHGAPPIVTTFNVLSMEKPPPDIVTTVPPPLDPEFGSMTEM